MREGGGGVGGWGGFLSLANLQSFASALSLTQNNIEVNGVDPSVVRTRVGDGTMLCYEVSGANNGWWHLILY
jgi:hypothetical protein